MAKHICIRIYDDGKVKVTKESETDDAPEAQKIDITGKNLNYAFWYKQNPTCVFHNGKWY